jgi:hypothetical protein
LPQADYGNGPSIPLDKKRGIREAVMYFDNEVRAKP